jgi:hypothetical protein
MASTIAAITTSGGGVVTTADSSGNLSLLSGATTVVAVTSTGVAVTGTLSATGAVSGTTGTFTGAVSGTTGTFTGAVTTPLSYVRLNTANGYGSTNTKIRRFTNIVNNVGTDITYADSATLGGTFTINTAGVYSVSYSDQFTTAVTMGISINSTQLTTGITSIAVSDVLSASATAFAGYASVASGVFYAAATSVIRAHTDTGVTGATPTACQFTIARVQ